MRKVTVIALIGLVLLFIPGVFASSVFRLTPGLNEVSIRIQNDCGTDLEEISLIVHEADLPDGITASLDARKIDAPDKKKSGDCLTVLFEVRETVPNGMYKIPLALKDKSGNSWNFTLTADVGRILPERYALKPNYPNPFNPETHIAYDLADAREHETLLIVYNALGRQVRTLVNKKQQGGRYSVCWDGKDNDGTPVPSGLYFYKLSSGSFSRMKKMMLIK